MYLIKKRLKKESTLIFINNNDLSIQNIIAKQKKILMIEILL